MLNEERIKLMTKMACYEQNEGRKNVSIGGYFRGDYIALQVIKSLMSATIAFCILFGLFIMYDFEVFMGDLYKMDLLTILFLRLFTALFHMVCTHTAMRGQEEA